MKHFLFLLFFTLNLSAQGFIPEINFKESAQTIDSKPLLELLAGRDSASALFDLGGEKFYATYVFDDNWNTWFSIKPENGAGAGAWKESHLDEKVYYSKGQLKAVIGRSEGKIYIQYSRFDMIEMEEKELFARLYEESPKITFGDAVTYAYFRNLAPLSENEGIITMRKDSEGNFFFSLTNDKQVNENPRWLLAVNGVLYGLKVKDGNLVFVSKKINIQKLTFLASEKQIK